MTGSIVSDSVVADLQTDCDNFIEEIFNHKIQRHEGYVIPEMPQIVQTKFGPNLPTFPHFIPQKFRAETAFFRDLSQPSLLFPNTKG